MESDIPLGGGARSRSTEPPARNEEEATEKPCAQDTGGLAGASSEALDPVPSPYLGNNVAETADSLPEELSEFTAAMPSLGDEQITAATLQKRMPTLRQTYRSTAPSHPMLDNLSGTTSKLHDSPGAAKAQEPSDENTVPVETEKRGTYASFWSYCQSECDFNIKSTSSSSLFGETTRDKLYNSLFLVGPHLERYMAVGFLKCLDYLLGVLLLMPLQAGAALLKWMQNPLKQRPIEIFHVAMLAVFACCCVTMVHVRAGGIYFWLKDISPVFLKIHAVYNALDILNKVFRSFAIDAVASMSSSCSVIADSSTLSGKLHGLLQLISDSALSWVLISLNSLTMMTQAIIYSVALNIGRNELVALMIATSFMEVKGVVYKRFDEHKLLDMARTDLEERFTLFVALTFVIAEDLLSTGHMQLDWSMVWECVKIFLCEMLVDVLKHVTLAKFNNVRPGTYREFFRSLVKDAQYSQGYAFNTVATVDQFGCAALLARQAYFLWCMTRNTACETVTTETAFSDVDHQDCIECEPVDSQIGRTPFECSPVGHIASAVGWISLVGSVMFVYKFCVGFCLHTFVTWYSAYYEKNYKTMFKKRL